MMARMFMGGVARAGLVLILVLPLAGCGFVETMTSDTSVAREKGLRCADFDELWNATMAVLQASYTIVEKDRNQGIIIARAEAPDSTKFDNRARGYPDVSTTTVRVQLISVGETYTLKVVVQQRSDYPREAQMRPMATDRSKHVGEPRYMGRYRQAEQDIIRQVKAQLEMSE